ncbi:hypothetical protein [Amycolatopsis japonica]|uniref:hypothetical protein n=1 Tax=Amycolatopsis japonica TaxID=208439 RepID=UPI00380303A7
MEYVESGHVQDWVNSGKAKRIGTDLCQAFHEHLLRFPWLPSRVDWARLGHVAIDTSELDDAAIVERVRDSPMGVHSHILIMYTPDQDGLVCRFEDAIGNLDLLYWKSPGVRYFCGVDLAGFSDEKKLVPSYSNFAEYDGSAKITVCLSGVPTA